MNYLGKYLKKIIKEKKVSEREIASRCGISHSYLNQLIKGMNPSTHKRISPTLVTFEKLSKGFGVSVDCLQQVARGLVRNENDLHFNQSLNSLDNVSPNMIRQITDFKDFILLFGEEHSDNSEEEWNELIGKIKIVIKEHVEEKSKV